LARAYEDVTTPVPDSTEYCKCWSAGADGFEDLTIKFDKNAIVAALGPTFDGQVIPLYINGVILDGFPIEGVDCVIIRGSKSGDPAYTTDPGQVTSLIGASPNPFNPTTTIRFGMEEQSDYTLTIYNVTGQVVHKFSGIAEAGDNSVVWDASSRSSGVYFYRLETANFTATKKMVLLK